MKYFTLAISVILFIGLYTLVDCQKVLINKNDHTSLDEAEKCEIDLFVVDILNLIVAEERSNKNVSIVVENELLPSYVKYFRNVLMFLMHGVKDSLNNGFIGVRSNYKERMNYFSYSVSKKFSEILIDGCTENYDQKLKLMLDKKGSSTFIYEEIIMSHSIQCSNKVERMLSPGCKSKDEITVIDTKIHEIERPPTGAAFNPYRINETRYSIIPMPLIGKFYKDWIGNSIDAGLFRNKCPVTARINHWLKKILSVDLLQLNSTIDRSNMTASLLAWSPSGNVFMGPQSRGPLDPSFEKQGEELLDSFEYFSEYIVEREHYEQLENLYQRLKGYINAKTSKTYSPFQKALDGFELLATMVITLLGREVTPFNVLQWKEYEITELLLSLDKKEHQNLFVGKKVWAIKKKSTEPFSINEDKKCASTIKIARRRWSEFVMYLTHTFLESQYLNEWNLMWAEGFRKLYTNYKFTYGGTPCSSTSFDAFLYFRVSRSQEWHDCVNFDKASSQWCHAWRRIMLNSDIGNKWKKTRPKQFYNDTIEMLNLLQEKASVDNSLLMLQKAYKNPDFFSGLEERSPVVCNIPSDASILGCPNDCPNDKMSERSKRIMATNEVHLYDREWFRDENNLKCQCSSDERDYAIVEPALSYDFIKTYLG